jgi:hypothetical protein
MAIPLDTKNLEGYATRNELQTMRDDIIKDIQGGRILLPAPITSPLVFAGGVNHCPNSDANYSDMAATVAGTLPATAGDTNQEAWRMFRQLRGANLTFDAAHALKAVDHSLYAADEGANPEVSIWNRVAGWIELGGETGADQYDIAIRLLGKIVKQSEIWFFLFRCVSLTADVVPADVQVDVGLWQIGATEGYATGDNFAIQAIIHGEPGSVNADYRVLAKTDSGVSILSEILNVPNVPDVLSDQPDGNRVTIFFNSVSNAGFIEFQIYKEVGGVFAFLFAIRNSVDLQYHDVGNAGQPATGWPAAGAAPLAYAKTRTLQVGPFGGAWSLNRMSFLVPPAYNYADTDSDGQVLRFGLTAETAVNRQIGIDYLFFSTTLSKWAPDVMSPFADGTYPVPSISPTSGVQGTTGGLGDPGDPGSGGDTCILTRMPVLVKRYDSHRPGRRAARAFIPFRKTYESDQPVADRLYDIMRKRFGSAAGYYAIRTKNGILYECNARHELAIDVERRDFIQAQQVKVGMKLPSWVNGKVRMTTVTEIEFLPVPADVGTYVLRDPSGEIPAGRGMYVAGFSKKMDRGLFSSNIKNRDGELN